MAADNQDPSSDNQEDVLADSADTNADTAADSDFGNWLEQDAADSWLVADENQFDFSNQMEEFNTYLGIGHNFFNCNVFKTINSSISPK